MKTYRVVANVGLVVAVGLVLVLGFARPALSQTGPCGTDLTKTWLIDFGDGSSNAFGSFFTPSPDIYGHYWNSINFNYIILTNAAGQPTSFAYGPDAITGWDSYNGPAADTNGLTTNPANSDVNTNALGCLSIDTAVCDYIVTCAFEIQGMNPEKTYELNFFGSLKYPLSEITTYALCNDNSYSTIITSVTLNVGNDMTNNTSQIAVLSGVSPESDGIMYILVEGTNTGGATPFQGILNDMSIVDLSTNAVVLLPPLNQTLLLDFGDNDSYRGTNTPSPDNQGHYWNDLGINLIGNPLVLTNAAGAATAITFMFDASNPAYTNSSSGFGTDSYNGPAGPTDSCFCPSNCVFCPSCLGYLGDTNAVFDYFVSAHFLLQNMNPAHQYSLTFFGSHKYSFDATTVYSVYSDPNYSVLVASTNLLVGAGAAQNEDTVAVISPISPQTNGTMYVKFIGSNGNLGYLNCMQVVDLTPPNNDPFTLWQTHYFTGSPLNSSPNADPLGKGIINTNQFLAGFNPTNSAAYPHILSIAKANTTNAVITYLGASGDSSYSPGFASRTNVLEFTTGTGNGSYLNNFVSTGQTNILSGGTGLGTVASFIQTNGATGPARYYRVHVLAP